MALTQITVQGTYKNPDGSAAQGTVTFQLNQVLQDSLGHTLADRAPIVVTLVAGVASALLYATDDPTTQPVGATYSVTESITNAPRRSYSISVPRLGGTINLDTVAPVSTVSPTAQTRSLSDWSKTQPTDGQIPVYVGATGQYTPETVVNSLTAGQFDSRIHIRPFTQQQRGILAAIGSAGTSPVKCLVLGDSIVELGGWVSFERQMASFFNTTAPTNTTSSYFPVHGTFAWSTLQGTQVLGQGLQGYLQAMTAGQTCSQTPVTGDGVLFVWAAQTGGGTVTLQVDGSTVATPSGATAGTFFAAFAVPNSTHTVSFTATGGPILADGIYIYTAANRTAGFQTWAIGHSGWKSVDAVNNTSLWGGSGLLSTLGFHHVLLCFGINDYDGTPQGLANYTANTQTLINNVRAALPLASIDIWCPYASLNHDQVGQPWSGFVAAAKSLTDPTGTNNVGLINAFEVFGSFNATGSWPTCDVYGMTIDGVHLATRGTQLNSDLCVGTLLGLTQQRYPAVDSSGTLAATSIRSNRYTETVAPNATSGTAATINWAAAATQTLTLTGTPCIITISNPPASGQRSTMTLFIKQDATGTRLITWPAAVKWPAGTPPTLSTAANSLDKIRLETLDGGTTYQADLVGKAYA